MRIVYNSRCQRWTKADSAFSGFDGMVAVLPYINDMIADGPGKQIAGSGASSQDAWTGGVPTAKMGNGEVFPLSIG